MGFVYQKQSRSERAAKAGRHAVFDSSADFGYIWPKYGDRHMITVPLGEAKIICQSWSMRLLLAK